ncbi:hypothetical protein MTP99_002734 [Tenebrio molitor]|jgi:hypothetical protein|nr:hypothetical protein MTP99_002734 [Tenebrio molitor]CAH1378980.1 unnamed protein product [Tenebrio molitor]
MEKQRRGSKNSGVTRASTSKRVRPRRVVNPRTHRLLVATSKWRVRSASALVEPAIDSDVVLRQQPDTIAILCKNKRLIRELLDSLLSRKNEEASPAPSTSMPVGIAPTPTTSATLTTSEDVQGVSGSSADWQQIAASLAAHLVRSPPPAGTASRRPRFTNSELKNPIRFLDKFQVLCPGFRFTPAEKLRVVIDFLARQARESAEYRKSRWETFEDFRQDFLRHYWLEEVQMKVFQQIGEKTYDPTRGTTMSEYFIRRVNQLRGLTLPFPEGFLVASLMTLFSSAVQSSGCRIPVSAITCL